MKAEKRPKWASQVWTRASIPRHRFTMWLFMQNPVLQRVSKFTALPSADCLMCKQQPETHDHLFFECSYAKEIWGLFCAKWGLQMKFEEKEALITNMTQMKKTRKMRHLIQALVSAAIYQIWYARNRQGFHYYSPIYSWPTTRS